MSEYPETATTVPWKLRRKKPENVVMTRSMPEAPLGPTLSLPRTVTPAAVGRGTRAITESRVTLVRRILLRTLRAAMLAVLDIAAALPCGAADRIVVSESNDAEISIKDRVRQAAKAVSEENLDAFVGCFTERQRPQIRRRVAMIFVRHTLDLELLDTHVVTDSGDKAELAVKYRMILTDDAFDIVSLLGMVKHDGDWLIATEKVESNVPLVRNRSLSSCGGPVFRFGGGGDAILRGNAEDFLPKDIGRAQGGGCANGRCGL